MCEAAAPAGLFINGVTMTKMIPFFRRSQTVFHLVIAGLAIFMGSGYEIKESAEGLLNPPVAEKKPKELTFRGHTRIDNYYWLNERHNPKVIEYLKAENRYKDAVMKHTEKFQEQLYEEITARIRQSDVSVPYKDQGYYYYTRFEEGNEYPIFCRKKLSLSADEEVLLNVNTMAEGHDYFHVEGLRVSSNNNLISYGVDTTGRRKYTLHFKNLKTGEVLRDAIPDTAGTAAWANDNKTVFYAAKDATLRPFKIMKHVLGTHGSADEEIYHESDETFVNYVRKSKSKKYIFIASFQTLSSEYRFLDADRPDGTFKVVQPRERGLEYDIEDFKDKIFIRTNHQAKNFRLVETAVTATLKENWKEVIPNREDVLLEEFEIFKNFLVLSERKNGLPQIRIIRWKDKAERYIDFGEETYNAYLSANPELDSDFVRFGYTSLTTPESIFDYNMNTGDKKLLKQEEVVGDFDPLNYHAERLYATARDGTRVPISLVYRKGLVKNGNNPLLLHGYGSYGISRNASFSSERLSILDRGVVYAIAHIRGGQEMGRDWYEDGKLLKKKNTFTDFIDCAEHLITAKFTNPDKLFAQGRSAGGLLMGAVLNMRPDLFKGVVADVPWVDVVTTMLDSGIPLTTGEYDEWGNPNKKEFYDYMLSYSPYDNVRTAEYPNILVTTGFHDSQVQYFEPAKWVAKLRALKTDKNILIFTTDMESGHGGASGRFKQYKKTALHYAFILDLLGISQ